MHRPGFNHWPGRCISWLIEGGEAHERRGNLLLQVAEHSSKWDSTWLVSEGDRKDNCKIFIYWCKCIQFENNGFGCCHFERKLIHFLSLPFHNCNNSIAFSGVRKQAIAPVLKTIFNALKFSCLLLFNFFLSSPQFPRPRWRFCLLLARQRQEKYTQMKAIATCLAS